MATKESKEETNEFLVPQEDRVIAAVGYLWWLIGLIIFLITDKSKRAVRFHALQSLVTGLLAFVVIFALIIISMVVGLIMGIVIPVVGGLIGLLLYLVTLFLAFCVLIYILFLAFKVFTEGDIRVPKISEFIVKYL
ncbi:MAG: hypothetical protein QW035_00390 [Candidatus Anstonellales archaeon]